MLVAEQPVFNPEAFDDNFFASYEQQLADLSPEDQASAALATILSVKDANGQDKTYDQIRDASRAFFANEWVQRDESLLNRMVMEFAVACLSHGHGAALSQDSMLGASFEQGQAALHSRHGHNHQHESRHDEDTEDNDQDGATTKKKKKREHLPLTWASLLLLRN